MTGPISFSSATVFTIGSLLAGAVNYLFSVVMAREGFLGPVGFGALAALSSVIYLDSVLVTTLTTGTARLTATARAKGEIDQIGKLIGALSWQTGRLGLGLALLLAAGSALIARFLQLPSVIPVLVLAPLLLVTLLLGVTTGALQGTLAFGALAVVMVVGAVARLCFAVLLVLAGLGVTGALLGSMLASLLVYGLSLVSLRTYLRAAAQRREERTSGIPRGELARSLSGVFLAIIGLTALFSMDLFLAKHYLSPEDAGLYGGLSTLGKTVYFVSFPLIMIMFPHATERAVQGRSLRRVVAVSGAAISLIALVALGLARAVPEPIIRWTIGPSYLTSAPLLWLFVLLFTAITAAAWLVHVFLAVQERSAVVLPLLFALVQVALISRFHSSVREIILSSLTAAVALCVMLGLWVLSPKARARAVGGIEQASPS